MKSLRVSLLGLQILISLSDDPVANILSELSSKTLKAFTDWAWQSMFARKFIFYWATVPTFTCPFLEPE